MSNSTTLKEEGANTKPIHSQILESSCGRSLNRNSLICSVTFYIMRIVPSALVFFGTVGNILSIIVLARPKFRKNVSSLCLRCLALADLITVWVTLLYVTFGHPESDLPQSLCIAWKFCTIIAPTTSKWLRAQICLVRAFMTKFPFFGKTHITYTRSLVAIAGNLLFSIGSLAAIFAMQFMYEQRKFGQVNCILDIEETNRPLTRNVFDAWLLLYGALIPLVLILVFNGVIVQSLCVHRRRFQHGSNHYRSLNVTVAWICIYILITYLPFFTFVLATSSMGTILDEKILLPYVLTYNLLSLLAMSNYCVNSVFFFMNSTMFKQEWKEMTSGLWARIPNMFGRTEPSASDVRHSEGQSTQQLSMQSVTGLMVASKTFDTAENNVSDTSIRNN